MPVTKKKNRVWSYGANTVISSVFFIGIIAFMALIAERHPWRLDLTESGAFTLSEQTVNVLKSLSQPIRIKAFYATAALEETKAKDLLETYSYQNKNITYEFIDPDRRPEVAGQYGVRAYGTLVLEGFDSRQTLQTADEESITNAILKLSRKEEKKVYFLTGHGERSNAEPGKDGYSTAGSMLTKSNYSVFELNLMQRSEVPKDAAAVIVAGPKKPLFPNEISSLKNYLDEGGRLLIFLDPYQDGGLKDFLTNCGIELGDDIVIDKLSKVFGGSYLMPLVMEYGRQKITADFGLATFYPEARSVRPLKEAPKGVRVEILASTSPDAWGETDRELINRGQAGFDDGKDTKGPIALVVLAEVDSREMKAGRPPEASPQKTEENPGNEISKKGYVLVAGDSDFAANTYFGVSGNGDLFLNMVNFLSEEEKLIVIEARKKGGKPLMLSQTQAKPMFWTVMVLMPLVVLISGFTVYRFRRAQR